MNIDDELGEVLQYLRGGTEKITNKTAQDIPI
jgi:hypothetical protein